MSTGYPEIRKLSLSEKLQLVEDLWDDIASGPDQLPIPEWHLEELDRRENEQSRNPQRGSSWDEVRARIRGGHG
jgi:putative addiction module component (TIGR02574 family)